MSSSSPALAVEGIGKRFSGVTALDDVSLEFRSGEVLALMGENGAGKSTLLRVLSGDQGPDDGRLLLDGTEVTFDTPRAAMAAGVRVIYQEPEIIPHVSVAENVFVGELPAKGRVFNRRTLLKATHDALVEYGFEGVLNPATLGVALSPAQRQLVEILRVLTAAAPPKVIAFDEPTSSLSEHEVEALFRLIGRLRDSGVAVVYVSHRMKEIFQLADRVAVLRDGKLVGVQQVAETDEPGLVRMMIGRDLSALERRVTQDTGDVVLKLDDVTTDDVTGISLEVRAGEVVCLAGLVGAGRSELARAIVGDLPIRSGTVTLDGKRLRAHNPGDAVKAGIGFAPEERKTDALLMQRSVRDNVSIAVLDRLRRFRVVKRAKERALVEEYISELRVRTPSMEQEVRKLSGGNQQKAVLARWLARRPKLLILDEPTRGVDVGAKAEIYRIIDGLAAEGIALLVISSDLPEVLTLADRILVMRAGHLAGEIGREDATEEAVLTLAIPETEPAVEEAQEIGA
ncbi:L-arabinose transport system ATP-binding protein [Amycolatopsis pretoriensis]|uniref:L-arabinose transport system ATP-binding protein n=1 Tax=Amycolatopsis pretoriensis TaxID=218821 RepID=A0A1H5RFH5_9PSEU|nr:sugar ABC transporter ATP-binding protein [Amycolatopsis pretoriensis]SEF36257.1 L-arabinose transport system ATP-binding protein [Amycolatopsis pretoriensis]